MIRKLEWSAVVVDLTDVVALTEDTITPRRNASFFGCIIDICSDVVFVSRKEGDAGL
jgi:hypothetical protein